MSEGNIRGEFTNVNTADYNTIIVVFSLFKSILTFFYNKIEIKISNFTFNKVIKPILICERDNTLRNCVFSA